VKAQPQLVEGGVVGVAVGVGLIAAVAGGHGVLRKNKLRLKFDESTLARTND
jgi:hypothetical protein